MSGECDLIVEFGDLTVDMYHAINERYDDVLKLLRDVHIRGPGYELGFWTEVIGWREQCVFARVRTGEGVEVCVHADCGDLHRVEMTFTDLGVSVGIFHYGFNDNDMMIHWLASASDPGLFARLGVFLGSEKALIVTRTSAVNRVEPSLNWSREERGDSMTRLARPPWKVELCSRLAMEVEDHSCSALYGGRLYRCTAKIRDYLWYVNLVMFAVADEYPSRMFQLRAAELMYSRFIDSLSVAIPTLKVARWLMP